MSYTKKSVKFQLPNFKVPLTRSAHLLAEKFRSQQAEPVKAKQVYLNTLAVYAVKFYLQCMGIATDLEKSESQDSVMVTLLDVADIEVKDIGKLECRPVLPDADMVRIPPEVWSDRIGYMAVLLNESLTEATLLGFVETVSTEEEELPITQLRSLDDFLVYLERLANPPVHLSKWLQNICDAGWQASQVIESFLSRQQAELAFSFRGANTVERGKLIKLTQEPESKLFKFRFRQPDHSIALLVELLPVSESTMDIWVKLYPTGGQTHLPQELQLKLLDEEGKAVVQTEARKTENLKLRFSGSFGERFSLMINLGNFSFTECFII